MADGYARTFDEARLYMELRPCDCGETRLDSQGTAARAEAGGWLQEYVGFCPRCGRRRSFTFEMPPGPTVPRVDISYGPPDEPSRLLDPGEWLTVADAFADNARLVLSAVDPTGDDLGDAYHLLMAAEAATAEVLKFLPPDATRVPASAFRAEAGLPVLEVAPERFEAAALGRDLADRHRALAEFEARFARGSKADGEGVG
jgi:hypothetical protein